jgi:hypothetical protein
MQVACVRAARLFLYMYSPACWLGPRAGDCHRGESRRTARDVLSSFGSSGLALALLSVQCDLAGCRHLHWVVMSELILPFSVTSCFAQIGELATQEGVLYLM